MQEQNKLRDKKTLENKLESIATTSLCSRFFFTNKHEYNAYIFVKKYIVNLAVIKLKLRIFLSLGDRIPCRHAQGDKRRFTSF